MERNDVRAPVSYVVTYIPCRKITNIAQILPQYFSEFYCNMDTSRIVRVGTRIYVIRIAAVSQEHVPVCITRKITPAENDMVLVLTSKLIWLLCGWSKYT